MLLLITQAYSPNCVLELIEFLEHSWKTKKFLLKGLREKKKPQIQGLYLQS